MSRELDEKRSIVFRLKSFLPQGKIYLNDNTTLERQSEGPSWVQYRVKKGGSGGVRYFEVKITEHY